MHDVIFKKRYGGGWLLGVRMSTQASIAESFLRNKYGIVVKFEKAAWWYRAVLPDDLPDKLVRSLKRRAALEVPKRGYGPL